MKKKSVKNSVVINGVRPIDHVVLSVPGLKMARQRFEQLGFNVAGDARHNFGTQNAIIPFKNGTFIEPLAIGDPDKCAKYERKGNPFLVRDKAYRFRHGGEAFAGGFSMVAFAGDEVKKDRKYFRKSGWRTGKMAVVKRPGLNIRATFVMDERAPDCTLFICERKQGVPIFERHLTRHKNGALRIARVTLVDDNPEDFIAYLQQVCGQEIYDEVDGGIHFKLANGGLSILSVEAMKTEYGISLPQPLNSNGNLANCRVGLRQITYDIAVRSLDDTAMLLAERGIEARQIANRIVVANSSGQGAMLAFVKEENT